MRVSDNGFVQQFNGKQLLGWKIKLVRNRSSYFVYIPKQTIMAAGLRQGDELYSYLYEKDGRPVLVVFLDKLDVAKVKRND